MLASFEQIRLARADDPELARGQIVLVTDGEAAINDEALRRAREDIGDIPVGVSVIALGTENPISEGSPPDRGPAASASSMSSWTTMSSAKSSPERPPACLRLPAGAGRDG